MKIRWIWLLILLCILNMLDALFTVHIVGRFGTSIEANPLMRYLLELGSFHFLVCKIVLLPIAFYFLYVATKTRLLAKFGFALVSILYFLVVLFHMSFLWV